jgi:hypothetical protein
MADLAEYKTPALPELFSDNIEEAFKGEQLNLLLNQPPKPSWIKTHPYISNYKYLPIDKVEFMLRKIFQRYRIEITGQGTAFNGVWVTVRVHYLNPITQEFDFHDGIGACQLQTAKGTSPADLGNINNGALSMAFPIAKTVAIKDACDHFGNVFGANLNRKDTVEFSPDAKILEEMNRQKQALEDLEELFNLKKESITDLQFLADCQRVINDKEVESYSKIKTKLTDL